MVGEVWNELLVKEKLKKEAYPEDDIITVPHPELLPTSTKEHLVVIGKEAQKFLGKILDKKLLAQTFIEHFPLYYDDGDLFWLWNKERKCWERINELDIIIWIDNVVECNVINSKERFEILQALKMEARKNKPKPLSKTMIQFDKEVIDFQTGDRFIATPRWFCTHAIPHRLGTYTDTPIIDNLFKSWVCEEDISKLYEICAFSMIPDYFIETMIFLFGAGSNGKSIYRNFIRKLIGDGNCCSTSIQRLQASPRFEVGRVYKKLLCEIGETSFAKLDNTDVLKKIVSGKDLVTGEEKGKPSWDFINYAKILISTNSLPQSDDKSDGFYRKCLIIQFPNQFEGNTDILATIPEQEYENFCMKMVETAYQLYKKREFDKQGTIHERKMKYEELSNPMEKFIKQFVVEDRPDSDIPVWEFEKKLNEWLREQRQRQMSDVTVAKMLKEKGIQQVRIRKEWYEGATATVKQVRCWAGLGWK